MSYYIINKYPVFMSVSRYREIQARVSRDKNAAQSVANVIAGSRDSKDIEKFVFDFLQKQYEADPVHFRTNWATFDIAGEEAAREVWDLLSDYCQYYGYGYLSDLRDFAQQLVDDAGGDSPGSAIGQIFSLNHIAQPGKGLRKYFQKMNVRTVSLIIIAKNVTRLVGDLSNFSVYTRNFRIVCGPNFGVYPLLKNQQDQPEQ